MTWASAPRWLAGLVLAATGAGGGCALEPDVGPLLAGTCDNRDTHPEASVSFAAQIQPVITRRTAGCTCHLPGSGGPGIGTALSGLNLASLSSLRQGGTNSGARIVVPGEPCGSILYQKVYDAPPFGSRMPFDGPPFLSDQEIAQIHDWIAEGANDN
jgi:hypothetical protein